MKYRIPALLLIFALLFCLTACGGGKQEAPDATPPADDTPPADNTPAEDEAAFTINGLSFRLDTDKEFRGLRYAISGDFGEVEHDMAVPYVQYNYYPEDGSNLLFFRIFYYPGKGDDYAVKDLGIQGEIVFEDFSNGELEFRRFVSPRDDGGTMNFYFLSRENDTYVLSFISRHDIHEFEDKVMKTVRF